MKNGSEEMMMGNEQILRDVVNLSEISTNILHSIEEISVGNNQINTAVVDVVNLAETNKDIIGRVNSYVNKFKLKE
ncbi:MAG: hypothetical protein JXR64_02735 [Spirochaetales bacterium]|nr:hypothetical protein [Spirochaetales bacterium]